MILRTKYFMVRLLDRYKKHFVVFGIYTRHNAFGWVFWDKDKPYDWS